MIGKLTVKKADRSPWWWVVRCSHHGLLKTTYNWSRAVGYAAAHCDNERAANEHDWEG